MYNIVTESEYTGEEKKIEKEVLCTTELMFKQRGIKDSKAVRELIASFTSTSIIWKIGAWGIFVSLLIIGIGYFLEYMCISQYEGFQKGGEYYSLGFDQYALYMKDVFNIQNIILANEGKLNYTLHGWSSKEEMAQHAKEEFDYTIQASEIINRKVLLHEGLELTNISLNRIDKSLTPIEFLLHNGSVLIENYNYVDSSAMMISALISLRKLSVEQYRSRQEDVYFYLNNIWNGHIMSGIPIFNDYVNQIHKLIDDKKNQFKTLLIIILCISVFFILTLIPIIYKSGSKTVLNFNRLLSVPRHDLRNMKSEAEVFLDTVSVLGNK